MRRPLVLAVLRRPHERPADPARVFLTDEFRVAGGDDYLRPVLVSLQIKP